MNQNDEIIDSFHIDLSITNQGNYASPGLHFGPKCLASTGQSCRRRSNTQPEHYINAIEEESSLGIEENPAKKGTSSMLIATTQKPFQDLEEQADSATSLSKQHLSLFPDQNQQNAKH